MRKHFLFIVLALLLAFSAGIVQAAPPPDGPPGLERAIEAQEAHSRELLSKQGVVGTAVGLTDDGKAAVKVFTEAATVRGIPKSLDGVPVVVQVTGKLLALAPPEGKGPPDRAPRVSITSPADGATFVSGATIDFAGTATDKEDGDLTSGLYWTSSKDGPIGQGGTPRAILSDGTHTITASVKDSGDNTGSDSITITVGDGAVQEPSTTDRWARPVPIGISTGNAYECSSGTIGVRVTDGTKVYALSNNHVYARENAADIGEEVLQPGLYDTNCVYDPANHLGYLSNFQEIVFDGSTSNTLDAAIAESSTSLLGNSTPSDGYGIPKTTTVAAALGMAVQKFGRTTGLTTGEITGTNAIVKVTYSSGTALFVNQVIVESKKPFLKAGDSGSLLVTNTDCNPVGLLFAGNRPGKLAIANDINLVLAAFGVTIDGQP
jgi:hypothetical protein